MSLATLICIVCLGWLLIHILPFLKLNTLCGAARNIYLVITVDICLELVDISSILRLTVTGTVSSSIKYLYIALTSCQLKDL